MENSSMRYELENMVVEYGMKISKGLFDFHVYKLKDYLIPYVLENFSTCRNAEEVFTEEFTKSNIINSAIYYIRENDSVYSFGAIGDFLLALYSFYQVLINHKFPQNKLYNEKSFSVHKDEIKTIIINNKIKFLKEPDSNRPLREEFAGVIIQTLDDIKDTPLSSKIRVAIKLLLIYGFKFNMLCKFKWENFDSEKRLFKVTYQEQPYREYKLDLPYNLYLDLKSLQTSLKEFNKNDYIFVNSNDNLMTASDFSPFYDKAKEKTIITLCLDKKEEVEICTKSIIKFAVINMIKSDMSRTHHN